MLRVIARIFLGLFVVLLVLIGWSGYQYYMAFGGGGNVYESVPPVLPAKLNPTAILIFTKTNGYRHGPAIVASSAALQAIAAKNGWSSYVTENGAVFSPAQLARFKAVIWDNTSGDTLLPAQRAAFRDYIEKGGGFVGIHAAGGDPSYIWRWYVDTLIGAQFVGHPMFPQFQSAVVDIEDRNDPATWRHLATNRRVVFVQGKPARQGPCSGKPGRAHLQSENGLALYRHGGGSPDRLETLRRQGPLLLFRDGTHPPIL